MAAFAPEKTVYKDQSFYTYLLLTFLISLIVSELADRARIYRRPKREPNFY
jgi:hypothetical protein